MIRKLISIILYCIAVVFVCDYDFSVIFNLREMVLVCFGTALLTFTALTAHRNWKKLAATNAIVTGTLATIIILLGTNTVVDLSTMRELEQSPQVITSIILRSVILKLRPLLYGFILFVVLHTNERTTENFLAKNNQEVQSLTKTQQPLTTGDRFRDAGLTRREAEIARMAATGLTNAEIAEILCIASVTVKTHMANILEKTKLSSRTELRTFIDYP